MSVNEDLSVADVEKAYQEGQLQVVVFAEKNLIGMLNGLLELNKQEEAIIGIFFRVRVLNRSVTRLIESEDYNATAMIARTIFELFLDLKILKDKKIENTIHKFHYFKEVRSYLDADRIELFQNKTSDIKFSSLYFKNQRKQFIDSKSLLLMEEKIKSIWGVTKKGKLKYPKNWTGLGIDERSKLYGDECVNEYLEIFKWLSSYVHSGNSTYSGFSRDQMIAVHGYTVNYIRKKYIEIIVLVSRFFKIDLSIKNFDEVINSLKNIPENILQDVLMRQV